MGIDEFRSTSSIVKFPFMEGTTNVQKEAYIGCLAIYRSKHSE